MSSIGRFAWTALYGRFAQSPAIQTLATGVGCLSQGKRLLCDTDSSSPPSLMRKIGRTVLGLTLLTGGTIALYNGGEALLTASTNNLRSAFLFGEKPRPPIEEDDYDLTFKRRDNVLYLAAPSDADHNGSIDPSDYESLVRRLDKITSLKYKVIRHPLQICEEIQSASKVRLLEALFLHAHGNMDTMRFSPTSLFKVFDLLPSRCFKWMSSARIFLQSCKTGQNSLWKPNLAQWISWISGLEVIASSKSISQANTQCWLDENNLLDMRFWNDLDISTVRFNTSTIWAEKAAFLAKMGLSAVFGAFTSWQLGSAALQGSGAVLGLLANYGATPTKILAQATGLYTPGRAQLLYGATKGMSQILATAGKVMQQAMNRLIDYPIHLLNHF